MADRVKGESFSDHILPLLFLTGIFLLNFFSRIVFSPLLPSMEQDLKVGHGEAGSFFLFISSGYFFALLSSGFVSARIPHNRTIFLSSLTAGGALLGISLCHSLGAMRLWLVVLGLATGLYLPSGISTISSLVSPVHWGKAIAIHELAPNLSFVAAPLIVEALLSWGSWRLVIALVGIIFCIASFAFLRWEKGGDFTGEYPRFEVISQILRYRSFWIMTILFSLSIGASMGIYTMLPLYLVSERAMDRTVANTLVSLSRLSGLAMTFVAGWTSDRLGPKRTMQGVLFLNGLLTIMLAAMPTSWIVMLVFLQPMIAVSFFPAGFSALNSIARPGLENVTVSLTIPMAFLIGGGTIPAAIGFAGEMGSFSWGIYLVGGLIVLGASLVRFLRS